MARTKNLRRQRPKKVSAASLDWPEELPEEELKKATIAAPTPARTDQVTTFGEKHDRHDALDEAIHPETLSADSADGVGPLEATTLEVLCARFAAGDRRINGSALHFLLDGSQCLLKRGKLETISAFATEQHECILLNDWLIVSEDEDSKKRAGLLGFLAANKSRSDDSMGPLSLKWKIALSDVSELTLGALSSSFDIAASGRTLRFSANDNGDQTDWVNEISDAVLSARLKAGSISKYPGWRHEVLRGTVWRAALDNVKPPFQAVENLDALDFDGFTAVHLAAYYARMEALSALLAAGADPNVACRAVSFEGAMPLHLAAVRCNEEAIFELLERGARADALDDAGQSAFFACATSTACNAAEPCVAERCLAALPHEASNSGRETALHICARRDFRQTTRLLTRLSASDLDARNEDGMTPLHVAALHDTTGIAVLLLIAGAKPNTAAQGETPLDIAIRVGALQAGNLLARRGSRLTTDVEHHQANLKSAFAEWDARRLDQELDRPALSKHLWIAVDSRDACELCDLLFSNLGRWRHHCHSCGRLCCQSCSTKTARLKPSGVGDDDGDLSANTSSRSAGQYHSVRVCDACFNKLDMLSEDRAPADKEGECPSLRVALEMPSSSHVDENMQQLGEKLQQRGEQLEHLAQQSEDVQSAAMRFRENTRKLREQLERRNKTRRR